MTTNEIFKMANKTTSTKNVGGYLLANPFQYMRENAKKNKMGFMVMDTPYEAHFDIPYREGAEHAIKSTTTAEIFKRIVEGLVVDAKKNGTSIRYKLFAYKVDGIYVRFSVTTSHDVLCDMVLAHIPLFEMEHEIAKKEGRDGRKLNEEEIAEMWSEAMSKSRANVRRVLAA